MKPLPWNQQRPAVLAEVAKFPETFGMYGYPNEIFRASGDSSYYSDRDGVIIYTQRLVNGKWLDFAKGTPADVRREMIKGKK